MVSQGPKLSLRIGGKRFISDGGAQEVIGSVGLDVHEAKRISIVGRSGAGKTTLLRIIAGLDTDCELRVLDVSCGDGFGSAIGFVFQDRNLVPWLTVQKNLEFEAENDPLCRDRIPAILGMLRLCPLENRYPNELSGGQKARTAIGRAMVSDPAVLLLDEPLTGLDESARWETLDELLKVQKTRGQIMVLITHDLEEAVAFGENLYVMHGRPSILTRAEHLESEYTGDRTSEAFVRTVAALRCQLASLE